MAAQTDILHRWFLTQKQAIFSTIPKLPSVVLEPLTTGGFVTKTIVEGAKRVIQSSDVLNMASSQSEHSLKVAAYIHSKGTGSLHYLASVIFPTAAPFAWEALSLFCTCKQNRMGKGSACVHSVAIVVCVYFIQNLSDRLPRWASSVDSLGPRSRSIFRDSPRVQLLLSSALTRQYAWFQDFEFRQPEFGDTVQSFRFDLESKKPHQTSSWKIASARLNSSLLADGIIHPPPQLATFTPVQEVPPQSSIPLSLPSRSQPKSTGSPEENSLSASPLSSDAQQSRSGPKTQLCSKCKGPRRGHKRGMACPQTPSAQTTDPVVQSAPDEAVQPEHQVNRKRGARGSTKDTQVGALRRSQRRRR